MRSIPSLGSFRFASLLAPAAFLVATGPAFADAILQVYAPSLTTMKPSTETKVQKILPIAAQRGVNLDGSLRAAPSFPMALQGNPFENSWNGKQRMGDLRVDLGSFQPSVVDFVLPTAGVPWPVSRSFNARQETSGGSHRDSDGPSGINWMNSAQPEILFYDDATSAANDLLYVVFQAGAYVEFRRYNEASAQFVAKNGGGGAFDYQAGTPDLWVYTDQRGTQYTFLGFNTSGNTHDGCLWRIVDENSTCTYVGDASSASTAISTGWDASGRVLYAYDAIHRFTYAYSTLDSVVRLTQVKAETKTGGTWASPTGLETRATVDYSYYGPSETYGSVGDLKMAVVTLPLTDSGVSSIRKSLYRYWKGAWDTTTNPGHDHEIQYVYEAEGLRQYDWKDSTFNEDFLTASSVDLAQHASAYMEYDSSRRVRESWSNGQCGCGGGGSDGTHAFTYENLTFTDDPDAYDEEAKTRTIVGLPDGSFDTQEFDEIGQALALIHSDAEPGTGTPNFWVTAITRDANGAVMWLGMPENVTAYTFSTAGKSQSTTAGLVLREERTTSGDLTGFKIASKYRAGTGTGGSPTTYFQDSTTYTTRTKTIGDVTLVRPLIATRVEHTVNDGDGTSGTNTTSYSYGYYSSKLAVENVTVTYPAVSTGNNGSNSGLVTYQHFRQDGLVDFERSVEDRITYHAYTNGRETTRIEDADTGSGDFSGVTVPTGPPSYVSSGTELHKKNVFEYDGQGRRTKVTSSFGSSTAFAVSPTYYSRLGDHRLVTLTYPEYTTSGSTTYYGPVQYTVSNQAGKSEVQAVIAVTGGSSTAAQSTHIDEGDSNPISAVDTAGTAFGAVAQMTMSLYDDSGTHVEEERRYFVIPGSGLGSEGTNFDTTFHGYDSSGRRWRVKEPSGTIRRTVFDKVGRQAQSWIGTNDHNFSGGESAGTDNMVMREEREYDGDGDMGNSLLTKLTRYVEDSSTGERVTDYLYDYRGRQIVELPPSTLPPFTVRKVDNLGRVLATGQYSLNSALSASTDPTSAATNRMALSDSAYDEQGREWKTTRHRIDATDGSDDDTLTALTWYDAEGRTIKTDDQDGLTKAVYDRLGRETDRFVLAVDNDSGYSDVDDVIGDIVLEQDQTRYDTANGTVILEASIARLNTDISTGETTGKLDLGTDGTGGADDPLKLTASDVKGRAQISAMWYDALERVVDRVEYGTNSTSGGNISTFDRGAASVPSRTTDPELVTTTVYNTDGTVLSVMDPLGKTMRFEYDALGRRTKEINNYGDGTPSGTDSDVTVRYEYKDGLRTKLIADQASADQETLYIYGTTEGTPSASTISTGHLLRAVRYPDSTNTGDEESEINSDSSDVVSFAYNAQEQETYRKDQGGNVIEADFDTRGRQTQRRVTTLGTGFDGAVRRIATSYDSLGRTSLVTQHDNATVGSGSAVDEVKYSYDGWGNVSKFEQDRNSAISGDAYEVSCSWAKGTTGRNTLRRDQMGLPSAAVIEFQYLSAGGRHDNEASRVSSLEYTPDVGSGVVVASYEYLGSSEVVATSYDEADVMWKLYTGSGTTATYPDLDRFNRVVKSRWTKDLGSDVDLNHDELTYDRNSNITSADDQVHVGFDRKYAMDNTDRLVDADEGTLSSGSITSRTRRQQWTLSQTGNWDEDKLDLTGDGDWSDTNEWDDCRTHNVVNELTHRNTNCDGGNEHTLAYDAAGNMTDDGKDYKYEWDAFYRLRKVKNQSNALVAEFRYNGVGYRIGITYDTNSSGGVDGNDLWYFDAFDESWRVIARFRSSDTIPKEEFVAHQAGYDGDGGSSYIDLLACRYKDANTAWTTACDGTLEERVYFCQNQHADVSAIVSSAGGMLQWVKYSAYGVPFGLPGGDTNSDGDCDAADVTQIQTWIDTPAYDLRGDLDLDGDVDGADKTIALDSFSGATLGRNKLSTRALGLRRAYAGQESLYPLSGMNGARNRVLCPPLGRWLSRDPDEYQDDVNMLAYVSDQAITLLDPLGLMAMPVSVAGTIGIAVGSSNMTGKDPDTKPPRFAMLRDDQESCCNECWDDLQKKTPPESPGGAVCCCNGKLTVCEFVDKFPGDWSDAEANKQMKECIKGHEKSHIVQGDHSPCDPAQAKGYAPTYRWGSPNTGSDKEKKSKQAKTNKAEASGSNVEVACLTEMKKRCKSNECKKQIQKRIDQMSTYRPFP